MKCEPDLDGTSTTEKHVSKRVKHTSAGKIYSITHYYSYLGTKPEVVFSSQGSMKKALRKELFSFFRENQQRMKKQWQYTHLKS